jgi:hypothetical protein
MTTFVVEEGISILPLYRAPGMNNLWIYTDRENKKEGA